MNKHIQLYNRMMDYAKANQEIRVVEMNGSRVNDLIEPDDYQDFDIVYYVKDYEKFMSMPRFIDDFGDILVMQTKDDQRIEDDEKSEPWYVYLIQFKDGTRLDLTIKGVSTLHDSFNEDSLSRILLDKDGNGIESTPNESSYYIMPPTKEDFHFTVNEFYWVCPYVGKGMVRNQPFYAHHHLEIVRKQLEHVLDWWIGIQHQFKVSSGKGKHRYQQLLKSAWYQMYCHTYCDINLANIQQSLMVAIELFDQVCRDIVQTFQFKYDLRMKNQMIEFIKKQYIKK